MIFRLKVFIPTLVLSILAWCVVAFWLDTWVKNALEDGISALTQTKTDIRELRISFLHSSLRVKRLEIASRDEEFKNAVEFEDIIVDFQTLPLFKKRFFVDDFSVKGIRWGTKRATSGRLSESKKSKQSSAWLVNFKNGAIERFEAEIEKMPLSQITDFRIPSDPREILDKFDMKSTEAFKAVATHAQEMRGQWNEKLKEMRDFRAIEAKVQDVRSLAKDVPSDPQEVLRRLKAAEESYEFFKKEHKRLGGYVDGFNADVLKIKSDYQTAVTAFDQDYEKAKSLISIDQLKFDNLSRVLFGPQLLKKYSEFLRLHSLMRRLLASETSSEDVQVRKRSKGRDIIFISPKKEPDFVLKHAEVSVKGVEAGDRSRLAQLYELKLADINSSPQIYGKPSSFEFLAQLKEGPVSEVAFEGDWDYTTKIYKDNFKLSIRKIRAENWPMGIPQYFPLKMESGVGVSESNLRFEGDAMKASSRFEFSNIVWNFKDIPKQGLIVDLLQKTLERMKSFHFEMILRSSEKDDLDIEIKSDLDALIQDAMHEEIQKKLNDFQIRMKRELENRIQTLKGEADRWSHAFESEVRTQVDDVMKRMSSYQNDVQRVQDDIKKRGERQAADKISDKLKDVLPSNGDGMKKLKKLF